jgi:hypothetical protein
MAASVKQEYPGFTRGECQYSQLYRARSRSLRGYSRSVCPRRLFAPSRQRTDHSRTLFQSLSMSNASVASLTSQYQPRWRST